MAEDEQAKPAPEPEAPSPSATDAPVEPVPPPEPLAEPPAPPNKLHEWGAALGIMMFLALMLWIFLNFLRSASSSF